MEARFKDQVILVPGGTGALGAAVSCAFLRDGASVVVTYRAPSEYEALRQRAGADGSRLQGCQIDVTDEAAMSRAVATMASEHGRLDALVNTVGGYSGGTKLWEADSAVLNRMLSMNLLSAYVAARSVLPILLKQGRGSIVSVAAKAAVEPTGGAGAYAASKAAALALMRSLALDAAGSGVRVNSVLPSIIDTPANRRDMPKADFSRWPKPEAIAAVILFLCSSDAALINGAAIPVYG